MGADEQADTSGVDDQKAGDKSLISAGDDELQAREVKVVNPWIHAQTHVEYLEGVKVRFNFIIV